MQTTRPYFTWMAGTGGRLARGAAGALLIVLGYASSNYSPRQWMIATGIVIVVLAVANVSLLAPLFGYPLMGGRIRRSARGPSTPAGGEQGKPGYRTGSTTAGGSNFGQGSAQLGPDSYSQGREQGRGSNYDNETGASNN